MFGKYVVILISLIVLLSHKFNFYFVSNMIWQCKLCADSFTSRNQLFRHYRLRHCHYSRISPLPCLYTYCICTFQTLNALSTHLSRYHTAQLGSCAEHSQGSLLFKCSLCTFQQPFSESTLFTHLRKHLKNH